MSETEERTSIIDLEGTFRTTEVGLPEIKDEPEQTEKKPEQVTRDRPAKKARPDDKSRIAELKASHAKKMQEIVRNHREERKMLQKEIKEQAKKSRDDLGKTLRETEKKYQLQLEQLRKDYEFQSTKLQNELEGFLEGKMAEMNEHNEKVVANDSQERLEKLQEWLHGEFVSELQTKTNELEQNKASSEVQTQKLVHEIDEKNQEIIFLQDKIKEISLHLKRKLRDAILDELGLEEEEPEETDKKKKEQKKGFFAKLSSIF